MTPKVFGRARPNLVKMYEILRAAETPLPRTRVLQASNLNNHADTSLFFWMVERGFLEEVSHLDLGKIYLAGQRKPQHNKGLFRITIKGRNARRAYDNLFDVMELYTEVRERFPEEGASVKIKPFSGQKVRV